VTLWPWLLAFWLYDTFNFPKYQESYHVKRTRFNSHGRIIVQPWCNHDFSSRYMYTSAHANSYTMVYKTTTTSLTVLTKLDRTHIETKRWQLWQITSATVDATRKEDDRKTLKKEIRRAKCGHRASGLAEGRRRRQKKTQLEGDKWSVAHAPLGMTRHKSSHVVTIAVPW